MRRLRVSLLLAITFALVLIAAVTPTVEVSATADATLTEGYMGPVQIAESGMTVERLAGTNRFGTAAAVSASEFDPGVDVAYIATGANFPDALAGGPVAGLNEGPILLAGSIPGETRAELTRLQPKKIVILGGPGVVSDADAKALESYTTGSVERLAGTNRFATAAAISASQFTAPVPVVYIATGANFPDALAGGPVAALNGGPILLVNTDDIPGATSAELTRLQPQKIVILGGAGVVSATVETQLSAYTSGSVQRLFGANRFATAAAISRAQFSPGVDVAYIATGTNFPDALAGGPVAGINGGPILLVTKDTIPGPTATELARLEPKSIVILGGPGVVSTAVENRLAIGTSANPLRLSVLFSLVDDPRVEILADALEQATGLAVVAETVGYGEDAVAWVCGAHPDTAVRIMASEEYVFADQSCGAGTALKLFRFGSGSWRSQLLVADNSALTTLDDLAGLDWYIADEWSMSSYVVPYGMMVMAGVDVGSLTLQQVPGHTVVVLVVYEDSTVFAPRPVFGTTYVDARDALWERHNDVYEEVRVLAVSPPVPNVPVAFGPDFPPNLRSQIEQALVDMADPASANHQAWEDSLGDLLSADGLEEVTSEEWEFLWSAIQAANLFDWSDS